MENIVSIIIPVYNTEKYLQRCLDSVVRQTYPYTEIILVDDGSTDNSGKICDQYADSFDNVFSIHKKNDDAEARNYGVEKATGEWIAFVDSDDYVEDSYIKNMVELQKKYACDMVVTKAFRQFSNNENLEMKNKFKSFNLESIDAIFEIYTGKHAGFALWGKLIKKEYLLT